LEREVVGCPLIAGVVLATQPEFVLPIALMVGDISLRYFPPRKQRTTMKKSEVRLIFAGIDAEKIV